MTPYQVTDSKFLRPASIIVGNSGTIGERFALVTARAFNFPDLTCGMPESTVANMKSDSPLNTAVIAGRPPVPAPGVASALAPLLARWRSLRCALAVGSRSRDVHAPVRSRL